MYYTNPRYLTTWDFFILLFSKENIGEFKIFGMISGISRFNIWLILLVSFITKISFGFLFQLISSLLDIETGGVGSDLDLTEHLVIVFIVPLIETLIFQFGIQELILLIVRNQKYKFPLSIGISSLAFSLTHYYSPFYIIMTLLSGIIYSTLYVIVREKTEKKTNAFCSASIVHIGYNLFEFLRHGIS